MIQFTGKVAKDRDRERMKAIINKKETKTKKIRGNKEKKDTKGTTRGITE